LPISTAKLTMKCPGELVLAKTRQVKGDEAAAAVGGASARTSQNEIKVKLAVKPRGKAKKKLNRKGKAKVKAKVTYTPRRQRSDHRWEHRHQEGQADQAVGSRRRRAAGANRPDD
jgi:ribonuclease PH